MSHPLEWVRYEAGEWQLFDKPGTTARERLARLPIASITGLNRRIGYHGSITRDGNCQFHSKSVAALKRQLEAALKA